MSRTATSVEDIAQDLIRRDIELGQQYEPSLFWTGAPFGDRWSLEVGTRNLKPFKRLERSVDVRSTDGSPNHESFWRFIRLYPEIAADSEDIRIYDIFEGESVRIRTRRDGSDRHDQILVVEHDLRLGREPRTTTADLGRMMLVDELIYEQGFTAERITTIQEALEVQKLVS